MDRSAHSSVTDRTKAGPGAGKRRDWRAARRPHADTIGFALFGAPSPLPHSPDALRIAATEPLAPSKRGNARPALPLGEPTCALIC